MKYIVAFAVFLNVHFASAQGFRAIIGDAESKGDEYYEDFAYRKAMGYYQDALAKDKNNVDVYLKIGDCYRKLNFPDSSEVWYGRALESSEAVDKEYYLYYAQALQSNKKYEEAEIWFEKYQGDSAENRLAQKQLLGLSQLNNFFSDSARYSYSLASINSGGLDFSPSWYRDGIVFVSSRDNNPLANSNYAWDESNFLDLFVSEINETGLTTPRPFDGKINTKYHEGPVAFYDNFSKAVFTRNNYHKGKSGKSKDGTTKLKLYFAEIKDDDWVNLESFVFNNDEYSIGHPAISEDGSILYFVSDMPGGYGGTDLYKTVKRNGQWVEPINLGPNINTEGNEVFPYLENDELYFASNGHGGLGGLDVFVVQTGTLDEKPKNLGHPINSSKDDYGLIINKERTSGFFSSNRLENQDNIYSFQFEKMAVPEEPILVRGIVMDNHFRKPLGNATVFLNKGADVTQDTISASDGSFVFSIADYDNFSITGNKRGFHKVNVLNFNTTDVPDSLVLFLEPPHHVISLRAIDQETGEYIPDAEMHVVDTQKNEVVEISVRGDFHHEFETKGGHVYTAISKHPKYFNSSVKDIQVGYDHEYDTLFFDIPMTEIVIGKAIKLNNIYYDVNKADIRPDAAKELDKLVQILVDNPGIKIELSSHTDSRGRDSYNQSLSQRRAESAVAYIIQKGIAASRITAKGYGESQLLNDCGNGVKCNNDQHQENRRTEFSVTSVSLD